MVPTSVTLKQVASQAGVSYQTVSKVLNHKVHASKETEERILQAAQQLGYRPNQLARSMRAQRSFMIGYSWERTSPTQVNHISDRFLTSMVDEAQDAGYHVLPFPYRPGEEQVEDYRELIDTGGVDGFVISSINYDDPRIMFLEERQFPFVGFGRSNPESKFPFVDIDGANGVRQAVEYLVRAGHRKVAIIGWPDDSRIGNERLSGYFDAMQAAGLPVSSVWVQRGEGVYEFGRQACICLLDLPEEDCPSAIVALNDTMAIGAMRALQERDLLPGKDVAVIGFDDAPMAQYLEPSLTTIRQPILNAGRKCVDMLVSLMKGEPLDESQVLLKPSLILRDSA